MYIPKVGDVIKAKNDSNYYTIVIVVNDFVGIIINNSSSIYFTSNFDGYFDKSKVIFPKEKFVPKKGDKCYYPLYDYSDDSKYSFFDWGGSMGINRQHAMLANGLLFATEQEAVEARDKMIVCLQN